MQITAKTVDRVEWVFEYASRRLRHQESEFGVRYLAFLVGQEKVRPADPGN